MPYKLTLQREAYKGGKNILAAENGLMFIEAGATLDATKFATGVVPLGTLVARNIVSGKFEKFTAVLGFTDFAVLNIDFDNDGANDVIAGELLIAGSVYHDKLPEAPSAEFQAANTRLRYLKPYTA